MTSSVAKGFLFLAPTTILQSLTWPELIPEHKVKQGVSPVHNWVWEGLRERRRERQRGRDRDTGRQGDRDRDRQNSG